ncbi:hypothetical protein [Actinoplanes sp. URMC 104]|uniref:hypothetical protein n=1 Tax=Actinoplanes sp. URMC 104 TaxID=3423409 RepID=UPI003F1E4688
MAAWDWPDTRIERVIDADTVDAMVTRDLGFGATATFPVRLRLNRIDAYKDTSAKGVLGARLVEGRTRDVLVNATTVKPYKYGGPKERAGEWMVEIVLPDGTNLSDLLVSKKLAIYWDGEGPRPAVDPADHPA